MSDSDNSYHISFFKPSSPHAKANRNMVLWLVAVWFVAIFGFQLLLRVIEKPTPEPAYTSFQAVWSNIESNSAEKTEIQEFAKASLSVLGKIAIDADDKAALNNAMSWSIYQLTQDSLRAELVVKIQDFEKLKAEIENISDPEYNKSKMLISAELSPVLDLSAMDIRSKILPLELVSEHIESLTAETKANLPQVMEKYLIHNQSFLTDMKFLGFPFHYFYTAVFLLILFVGICLFYCYQTDKLNAEFNIED